MIEITREQIETYVADVRREFKRVARHHACYEALISAWERQQETCKWVRNAAAGYQVECSASFMCGPESLTDNMMYYCHHCGRRIEEVKGDA